MSKQLNKFLAAFSALVPGLAIAHGSHMEASANHLLSHNLPLLVVVASIVILVAVRKHKSR